MKDENLALIDTDILIEILRKKEPAYLRAINYLKKYGEFNISCLVYYECLRGLKTINAPKKLLAFNKLMEITNIIFLDKEIFDKASEIYAFLKSKGELKGEFDILIGTTALVKDLSLVTNNERHYEPLKNYFGLRIQNWMK